MLLCVGILVMPHFSNWFAFIIVGLAGLVMPAMCGSHICIQGPGSDEHHVCVYDCVFSDNTFLFPNE